MKSLINSALIGIIISNALIIIIQDLNFDQYFDSLTIISICLIGLKYEPVKNNVIINNEAKT